MSKINCKYFQDEAFGYMFCSKRGSIVPGMCSRCLEKKIKTKYRNKKTVEGNVVYDSKKESDRAFELALLVKSGEIKDLKRQVPYVLIPKQLENDGKVLFRECKYVADFEYIDCKTGEKVVEDVKGFITSDFKLKQKMMYYFYHIKIKII